MPLVLPVRAACPASGLRVLACVPMARLEFAPRPAAGCPRHGRTWHGRPCHGVRCARCSQRWSVRAERAKDLPLMSVLDNRSGIPGSAGNSSDGPIATAGTGARRTHVRKVLAPIRFFSSAGSAGGTDAPGRGRQRPVRCVQWYRGSGPQQAAVGHRSTRRKRVLNQGSRCPAKAPAPVQARRYSSADRYS